MMIPKTIPDYDETFLAGRALSLFFDGTETSSTTLPFALYELALNPGCQEKLLEEISQILLKYGLFTAEALQQMIYLESILFESLRMHPVFMVMSKVCTQKYTLPKTTRQYKPITINPGCVVNISLMGIHM